MNAELEPTIEAIRARLDTTYRARELAYQASREATRHAANSIRAAHRGETARAAELRQRSHQALTAAMAALTGHAEVYYAGFLVDAQKEYAEAAILAAWIEAEPLPGPDQLGVEVTAWLNGLGEAASELRRLILDRLRAGRLEGCEEFLTTMDAVYGQLVTIDFPDAMTGGLRRTTDLVRGVLEKTRGDLTMALREQAIIDRLGASDLVPSDGPVSP